MTWKTADEADFRRFTGGDFQLILDNLDRLLALGADVTVRIPLIPGVNLSRDKLKRMGEILSSKGVEQVSLIPFHRLGSSKYGALGLPYAFSDCLPPGKTQLEQAGEVFENMGIQVCLEDNGFFRLKNFQLKGFVREILDFLS